MPGTGIRSSTPCRLGGDLPRLGAVSTRIYIASAEGHTGKSSVALGLLETLSRTIERVGVFRPISRSTTERDYVLELPQPRFVLADRCSAAHQTPSPRP